MTNQKKDFSNSLEKIAKSSVLVFIAIILSKVLTYIYRILIARNFGPETYGVYSLAIMVCGWFIALAGLGLSEGIIRYVPIFRAKKEKNKIKSLFSYSVKISLLTSIPAGIILFLTAGTISQSIFNNSELLIFLKYFSFTIPASVILSILLLTLRAHEKIRPYILISQVLTSLFSVILFSIFLYSGLGIYSVILSYIFGIFITLFVAVIVLLRKVPELRRIDKKPTDKNNVLKEVLSYSWPLVFVGIVWKIFHWTDSFFIGYFSNATEVGIYNAALPISILLTIPLQLFMQLFFPLVSREFAKGNKEEVKQLSQQVGKWLIALNLPIFIIIVIFPEQILSILFGQEYLLASKSLVILAIGSLIYSLAGISERLLQTIGKSKFIFISSIIVATINILLNIVLIPKYGIFGAATATTISLIILSLIFMIQTKISISILPIRRKMANIILAGLIPSILIFIIKGQFKTNIKSFIFLIAIFSIIYAGLLFAFKALDKNDIHVLKGFKNKILKNSNV